MNISHIDLAPVIYGVIMFVGMWVVLMKVRAGRWLDVLVDISVFFFVFGLHGGTLSGGFSAMIAALLAGLVFPFILRRKT